MKNSYRALNDAISCSELFGVRRRRRGVRRRISTKNLFGVHTLLGAKTSGQTCLLVVMDILANF